MLPAQQATKAQCFNVAASVVHDAPALGFVKLAAAELRIIGVGDESDVE